MEQKYLAKWLKIIIVGVAICGLIFYGAIIPTLGNDAIDQYPEFSGWFRPWLIFLWTTGVPCFIVLVFGWRVASNIGKDCSFSDDNAKLLKWISWLASGDSAFFFAGNIVMLFLNMNHPGVILASIMIDFAGVAVAVASAVLSHLVQKAAVLQEQSDLTI